MGAAGWRRASVAVVVALAVAAGVVAGAPRPAAAAPGPPPPRSVFVLGDSVMEGAAAAVRAALPEWQATIGTFVGLPTRQGIQALRERHAELGSVVVVELGANDWGVDPGAYGRLIDEAMGVLAGRHVVWLTSARFRPEMDGINGAIRAAAARHADLEVLEWGPLVDAHPDATYGDGYHLRPAGQRLMADAVRGVLERWWAEVSRRCDVPAEAAARASLTRLYQAYFLRAPDPAGFDYWLARYAGGDLCLDDVSEVFAGSPEFVAAYGPLGIPELVRRVYLNVLGREPDPDGYTFWAGRLASGTLRRGELMVGFSESPEFRARTGIA